MTTRIAKAALTLALALTATVGTAGVAVAADTPGSSPGHTWLINDLTGSCLSATEDGAVSMAACDDTDDSQVWDYNAVAEFENLATGQCLYAQLAFIGWVARTAPCGEVFVESFQWEFTEDGIISNIASGTCLGDDPDSGFSLETCDGRDGQYWEGSGGRAWALRR
jgi:hypothetical protein